MTSLRHFRDALFVVAAYFAVCAAVTDPQQAHLKDIAMQDTPPAPEGIRADVAITWHHHTELPKHPVRAIISIQPSVPELFGDPTMLLPELYDWDTVEGYWVSARTVLRMRNKEFHWAPIDTIARSAP